MDPIRFGRALRALRRRKRWRQQDVAKRARVSQPTISRLERGALGEVALGTVERVAQVLEARLEFVISWQGERLDRLLDAEHASLVESVVRLLTAADWGVAAEVSFNERGERGIVDVLAWQRSTRTLLVVEVKSVIADVRGTIGILDRKTRVSPLIARRRGWLPIRIARLLVVADTRTGRRRVAEHEATFGAAFPMRGRAVLRWLRRPSEETAAGLLFVPSSRDVNARQRIRIRGSRISGSTRSAPTVRAGRHLAGADEHSPGEWLAPGAPWQPQKGS
jgi:transcriptional regulator with XRE-family HTH domain